MSWEMPDTAFRFVRSREKGEKAQRQMEGMRHRMAYVHGKVKLGVGMHLDNTMSFEILQ